MKVREREIHDAEKKKVFCYNCQKFSRADYEKAHKEITETNEWKIKNTLTLIFLLILFVIPGLIYLMRWFSNKENVYQKDENVPVCHFCKLPEVRVEEEHSNTTAENIEK